MQFNLEIHLHFPFIGTIYAFKYNHLIELGVEGQKVVSQCDETIYM
jgi:hypothetical protein